jgi:VWFA-related protein
MQRRILSLIHHSRRPSLLAALYLVLALRPAAAEMVIYRGKVVMEDGSPPGRSVVIQRTCQGMDQRLVEGTVSPKTGDYFVRLEVSDFGEVFSNGFAGAGLLPCVLEAVAPGYVSTKIDLTDRRLTMNPRFPNIVLSQAAAGAIPVLVTDTNVPHAASKAWALAIKHIDANDWAGAEAPLRAAVEAAPKFPAAWVALGTVCENQHQGAEARQAFERAIALDPKPLPPYLGLAGAESELKDWDAASKTTETIIRNDSKHAFLEAYLMSAVARYQLRDFDGALARLNDLSRLDKRQDFPRAEYVEGLVYEARNELDAAAAHMKTYLDQHPHAKDFSEVSARLSHLGKQALPDMTDVVSASDLRPAAVGEAAVPGGMKAFAAVAGLRETPSYRDFFLQYCRAISFSEPGTENQTREAAESIKTFIATVSDLEQLGERSSDRTILRIAVDTEGHRNAAQKILNLLGWKLIANGDTYTAEPGDQAIDGIRQRFPAAFGIDELEMRSAIDARRPFQFEIPTETARLVGGTAWSALLKGIPEFTGGPAEVFIHDTRYAGVYAGLAAMDGDTAGTVVSSVGLANLIVRYSTLMAEFGSALDLADNRVAVPGGVRAAAAWAGLVGASPDKPAAFFRALFDKDQGRLLNFYYDLAHADAAHQQIFTGPTSRLDAIYRWYRDSLTHTYLYGRQGRWQAAILQEVRLDSAGKLALPGGREAWGAANGADADALVQVPSLQALAAVVQLENRRGSLLDPASVAILIRHRDDWRNVLPYLEKLPGLSAPDFQALASFEEAAGKLSGETQAIRLGDWHSLVELIVLASQSKGLNAAQAAQAFRQACEIVNSDNPSTASIAVLHAMAGGAADLDEALPARLLRLSGARRAAFDQIKDLQHVPPLSSLDHPPDARKTLAAISGLVYAAELDPDYLLVAEDPLLETKHRFLPVAADKGSALFADSSLVRSDLTPGSRFVGGFAHFREASQVLGRQKVHGLVEDTAVAVETPAAAPLSRSGPEVAPTVPDTGGTLFRVSGRLVEVPATVTDSHGRYVDNLTAQDFSIVEGQHSEAITAFENHTASVSVALLFDTTGSMQASLPSLKSAALRLLDELRPDDSVAVYGFTDVVAELQGFTTDKAAAKRAVLRTHAAGSTALYDALLRVNHDLTERAGKKVIVVFTDGDDNSSMLTSEDVIQRAKTRGVPIYTIAEGEALDSLKLLGQLDDMSRSTGGIPFVIHRVSDIAGVFQKISDELMHGYLLAFQPSGNDDHAWRPIKVVVAKHKGHQVRARAGYYPD